MIYNYLPPTTDCPLVHMSTCNAQLNDGATYVKKQLLTDTHSSRIKFTVTIYLLKTVCLSLETAVFQNILFSHSYSARLIIDD